MKYTFEGTSGVSSKTYKGMSGVPVCRANVIKLIGTKAFTVQYDEAVEFGFSYMTTKDYIIRFYK